MSTSTIIRVEGHFQPCNFVFSTNYPVSNWSLKIHYWSTSSYYQVVRIFLINYNNVFYQQCLTFHSQSSFFFPPTWFDIHIITTMCSASHLYNLDMLTEVSKFRLRMWTSALSSLMKLVQQPISISLK